jgi:hypothetical protein
MMSQHNFTGGRIQIIVISLYTVTLLCCYNDQVINLFRYKLKQSLSIAYYCFNIVR